MIKLKLSEENFEYDIRGLLMAFFPGEEITAKPDAGGGRRLEVAYGENGIRLLFCGGEGERVWRAEVSVRDEDLRTEESADPDAHFHGAGGADESAGLSAGERRKRVKSALKRGVYRLLSDYTGKQLPWGTLTGIRPTKIAMSMLEKGASDGQIAEYMKRVYLTGEEKTGLSIEIARREREILKHIDYENGYSLYIGIPFCPTTCLYCSFTSYPMGKWAGRMDEYLDALFKEIDYTAEAFREKKLNTVYIGGGTPTSLSAEQLDRLLTKVEESFDFSWLQEFTVEAGRPDSITESKLVAIRRHRVSRISINPQTMKQETLRIIGRRHTVEQIKEVYGLARSLGFDNINMDLILGLPGENIDDVRRTMEEIRALAPDNVTIHSLAVKRAARLNLEWDKYESLLRENSGEVMRLTESICRAMGLEPYYLYRQKNMAGNFENVGYALPGKAGIYNILIMEEKQSIVALGAGSTSKAVFPGGRIERADNVKDVELYLSRIDEMIERKRKLYGEKEN